MFKQTHTLHQGLPVYTAGQPLEKASAALILLHGLGSRASDILQLADNLAHPDIAYLAPQAANNSWYPHSFLSPLERNEPWLSSALQMVSDLLAQVQAAGIPAGRTFLGGFSRGACLAAEFAACNAQRFGGLLVFSGGLIGPPGTPRQYPGSLAGTPVFIGCSDPDPFIPVERVKETAAVLAQLGGTVTEKIYPDMGHTIIEDEIEIARQILEQSLQN